jgi:DNA polymerase III subunit epsilon
MLSASLLADCEFVAVDLETTGCRPGRNSIIEIGAVRFDARSIISEFSDLVRPDEPIPHAVEQLTGITASMVANAPSVEESVTTFGEFAKGAVLVAHNYRFDLSFLDHVSDALWGHPFHRPAIDTLSLAKRLRPDLRRFSLGSLAIEYGTATTPDHRAGNDARATAELLQSFLPDLERLDVDTVGELAAFCGLDRQSALAERLRLTRDLPDEAGVYLFRDESGEIIFVGRAKSLRLRTRAYFYPAGGDDHIAHDVGSIVAVRTPSALDAALLERRLIDRHKPRHNSSSHHSRAAYLISVDVSSPYPGMKVVPAPRKRGRLIGPFTSRWAAQTLVDRLQEVYGLRRCAKRLDARLAAAPCEFREAGSCPAPCVCRPDSHDYRARLEAAHSVFTDDTAFRERLQRLQHDAAADGRYEDAIRFRDGLRALDRAITTLRTVQEAAQRDVVLVEEHDGDVVIHLVRGGLRTAVLRGRREAVDERLPGALERVYFSEAQPVDPLRMSPEKVGELLTVASFEDADGHLEVPVTDLAGTLSKIRHALGLERKTPRRRHGAVSAD